MGHNAAATGVARLVKIAGLATDITVLASARKADVQRQHAVAHQHAVQATAASLREMTDRWSRPGG
jgi:hypothetical protein